MRAIRNSVVLAVLLVATVAEPCIGRAENDYPNRPVTLILPYAAGGVADVGMRIVAEKLSSRLKQQFVVENRPGAGGIVAAQAALAAAPDGYTLLMTGNFSAISVALFKSLPFNIVTDFASISTAAFFDVLLVTRNGSPLQSVDDVVKAARANPGKLNIGTINPGSTQNLAAQLFTASADIKATIVPFRSSPDMAGAVLRGDIDIAFEFYAAISGLLADKKLVAIASTGATHTAYLPNVPTVMASGIKDYEVTAWNGISAAAATPKPVIATLSQAMQEVLPSSDVRARASQMGLAMRWSTPEEMTTLMKADIAKYSAIVDKAGIPKQD
jgi:tripartite-type tricarboxylate transporter receptor subunit TctC